MSIQPPTDADQLHRQPQPPSSTTGNNLPGFPTLHLPHNPSPMTPTNHTVVNTNGVQTSPPESGLAASLGGFIFNIPSTSFQDAVATIKNNPLYRVLSDASVNQGPSTITTTTTPPKIPQNNPVSDKITTDDQQPLRTRKKKPLRRAISETTDHQPQKKTKTPPPQASPTPTGNGSFESERSRKMEDVVREIEQRCREMLHEEEHVETQTQEMLHDVEADNPPQEEQVQEECVGVERIKNGDLKFDLSCSCGERFEILIKPNGYCFYKLT